MKKILLTLGILSFVTLPVMAEQTTELKASVLAGQFQKAPKAQEQVQTAKMEKCVLCFQIIINGKLNTANFTKKPQN